MAYLTAADATARGITATDAQCASASAVVDAYLKRPEGLLWGADAAGAPVVMLGLTATATYALASPISPGVNVVAQLQGWVTDDIIGEVLIADRTNPAACEALVVTSRTGNFVGFDQVLRSHAGPLEAGLQIVEEKPLPPSRPVTQLSRTPAVRLMSGMGRYSYGRRGQQQQGAPDFGLISTLQTFTGTPLWQPFNVQDASVGSNGEVWIPAGIYAAYFSDVRLRYVAGWSAAALPEPIKQATASVLNTLTQFPELSGNMKSIQAGGTKLERFADQALDAETRNLLAPYAARLFA